MDSEWGGPPLKQTDTIAKEVEWMVGRQRHHMVPTSVRGRKTEACFPRKQSIREKFLPLEISLFRTLSPDLGSELLANVWFFCSP